LDNTLVLRHGSPAALIPDFYVPAARAATFPWVSHAVWFYSQMVRWRQIEFSPEHAAAARATYRPDLYRAALDRLVADIPGVDVQAERFFDGATFDAGDLTAA
jgi:NitT/TauT family transport system ATP-binding protein